MFIVRKDMNNPFLKNIDIILHCTIYSHGQEGFVCAKARFSVSPVADQATSCSL
jgi:hypothetical protein